MTSVKIDEGDVKKRLQKLKAYKSAGIVNLYPIIVLKELADVNIWICLDTITIRMEILKYRPNF